MLERDRDFTPVTASIVDRHVLARGSQEQVINNITRKDKEENPDLIILTPTCTSSILQEDLSNFVKRASLESKADIIPVSLKGTFEIMPIGSVKVKQGVVNMVIGKPIQYRKDKELLGEIRDTVIKNLE